jgi:predicted acetyltransferase
VDVEIRPIGADEVESFIRVGNAAFYGNPTEEQVEEQRPELPELGRMLGAFAGGQLVGTAGDFGLELTVPGRALVPMAGLSWVGVLPTQRRRGILTALMRRHLDGARERGEPLGGLEASEGGIYGRFGYGWATFEARVELDRDRGRLAPGYVGGSEKVELVGEEEARELLPEVHDRARRERVGDVSVAPGYWANTLRSSDRGHDGWGGKLFAICTGSQGEAKGGVVYRVPRDGTWGRHEVQVDHLVATSPGAYRSLWGFLAGLDLTAKVVARHRPLDEPLRWMLTDPCQLRVTSVSDHLWARLVDLPAALAARSYAVEGSVVMEATDPACPWNEGRWLLEGGPYGATCRRAQPGQEAELAMDASAFGSLYLGGVSVAALAAAGRVGELAPGAVARLGAMLAVDPPPWCSTGF